MSHGCNVRLPQGFSFHSVAALVPLFCFAAELGAATQAPAFDAGVELGVVATTDIWEASGIIASRQNPGVLWTHNDSGFAGSVFALSTNGALLARYYLPTAGGGDYEDLAFGPGPSPGFQYIYLGDIGDNFVSRTSIRVFRFPEPAVYAYQSTNPPVAPTVDAQEIELIYPDGPFNAEALLVDSITGDLFIATKLTNSSRIYMAPRAELDSGAPVCLTFVREISFRLVSGGDISADGGLVALRRGNRAAVWVRQPGQSIGGALGGTSEFIPVIGDPNEPNGEALGFHPTGLGYYTISEGYNQPIYFFRRTDAGVPRQPVVFIGPGDIWRYQDLGADEGTAWREPGFDDAGWAAGPAQLGYGQGDEQTTIAYGDDVFKNTTTYFRKQFSVGAPVTLTNLAMRLCFNDGVAVYLNGIEVLRRSIPSNATFDTPATATNSDRQNFWFSFPVDPALLHAGTNIIAAELHRYSSFGQDLSFDLQLVEAKVDVPPHFTGTPKLANGLWRVTIAGPAGALVTVQSSADLINWGYAGQVVLTDGSSDFLQFVPPESVKRFYRIQQME